MNNIKIENWCGYNIRFVEIDGQWLAILKDICDALDLRVAKVANRLNPEMLLRVPVEVERSRPTSYGKENYDVPSRDLVKSRSTVYMLAVTELGVYEALFASRRLEARKFRMWAATVLQKLRGRVGLEQYEVMRMTEPEIQEEIDFILDSLY